MKIILFFLFLFTTVPEKTFAQVGPQFKAPIPLPSNSLYKHDFHAPPKKTLGSFDQIFKSRNMIPVKFSGSFFSPNNPIYWLDRLYFSKNESDEGKTVFVRSNLVTSKNITINQIYKLNNDYLAHLKLENEKATTAVYFSRFSLHQVKKILRQIMNKKSKKAFLLKGRINKSVRAAMGLFTIENATAETYLCDNFNSVSNRSSWSFINWGILNGAKRCVENFFSEMYNASPVGLTETGIRTIFNPVEAYSDISAQISQMGNFMKNFFGAFGNFSHQLVGLPNSVKFELLCTLAGSLGGGAITTFLTAGTGSLMVMNRLASILIKIGERIDNENILQLAENINKAVDSERLASALAKEKSYDVKDEDGTEKSLPGPHSSAPSLRQRIKHLHSRRKKNKEELKGIKKREKALNVVQRIEKFNKWKDRLYDGLEYGLKKITQEHLTLEEMQNIAEAALGPILSSVDLPKHLPISRELPQLARSINYLTSSFFRSQVSLKEAQEILGTYFVGTMGPPRMTMKQLEEHMDWALFKTINSLSFSRPFDPFDEFGPPYENSKRYFDFKPRDKSIAMPSEGEIKESLALLNRREELKELIAEDNILIARLERGEVQQNRIATATQLTIGLGACRTVNQAAKEIDNLKIGPTQKSSN